MSGDETPASFALDYEMSAADLTEWLAVDGPAKWRRITGLASTAIMVVGAVVLVVVTTRVHGEFTSCLQGSNSPAGAPLQVWVWMCQPTSPSGAVWVDAGLLAGTALVSLLAVDSAWRAWRRRRARYVRRWIALPGVAGRHRDEIEADGVTGIGPDGVITFIPWSAVTGIRETAERLYLLGPGTRVRSMLPKRGLSDPASAPLLAGFLRAKTGAT